VRDLGYLGWFGLWCLMSLSTIFQLCRGGQFHWWRTRRKPPICHKSLTNFITHNVVLSMNGGNAQL